MAKWAPIRLGSAVDLLLSSVHRKQWGALSFSSWHEQELRCLRANHVLSIKARGSGRAKLISPNCTVPATGHIKLDNTQRKVSQHQGLIHPFRQVVASFQSRSHLSGVHRGVLRQLLLVLPLEELDAIFRIWLATEVAVGCGLLVLWLAQGQGRSNGTRSAIELNLQNVRDVVRAQLAALRVVALHEQRQWFGNTDGV